MNGHIKHKIQNSDYYRKRRKRGCRMGLGCVRSNLRLYAKCFVTLKSKAKIANF